MRRLVTLLSLLALGLPASAMAQGRQPYDPGESCGTGRLGPCARASEPAYWPGLGSPNRPLDVSLEAVAGENEAFAGRLRVRGAPIDLKPQQLWLGLTVPALIWRAGVTVRSPAIEVGTLAISRCGRFRYEVSGQLLLPSLTDPSPGDIEAAVVGMLVSGAEDGGLWLPLSDVGVRLRFGTQWRTADFLRHFAITMSIRVALGWARLRTWLGSQSALLGSVALETHLLIIPLNMRIGGHAAVSTGAAWSAGQVAPTTAEAIVGWSPLSELALEVFFGFGDFLQETGTQSLTSRTGLRLTAYVDFTQLALNIVGEGTSVRQRMEER